MTRTMVVWLMVGGLRAEEPAADAKGTEKEVEGIISMVTACVDRKEPIDVLGLSLRIHKLSPQIAAMNEATRKRLIQELGRLFVVDIDKIRFRETKDPVMTGYDPRRALKNAILGLMRDTRDPAALPALETYYRRHGGEAEDDPGGFAASVGHLIVDLGGTVPEWEEEAEPQPDEKQLQAMSAETKELVAKLGKEDLKDYDRLLIVQRLGNLARPEAEDALVNVVRSSTVSDIVRRDAISALGSVGGEKARALLTEELKRPMADANPENDGTMDAELRNSAVLALMKCGDEASLILLIRASQEETQYRLVRMGAKEAVQNLKMTILRKVWKHAK